MPTKRDRIDFKAWSDLAFRAVGAHGRRLEFGADRQKCRRIILPPF